MKHLHKNANSLINIPAQKEVLLDEVFSQQIFAAIDSNLVAWLPEKFPPTSTAQIYSYQIMKPLNNKELVESIGGLEKIRSIHLFSPTQIKYLVTQNVYLQKNGYQNLFFVSNPKTNETYLLGVVYDKSVKRFVPYIYRLRNLYRAWSTGNRLFLMS